MGVGGGVDGVEMHNVHGIKELCRSEHQKDPWCLIWGRAGQSFQGGRMGGHQQQMQSLEKYHRCFKFTQLDSVDDQLESNRVLLDL